METDARYADEMERALYNCAAAGVALDGKSFFYVNPLEVVPGIAGEADTHRHVKPQRAPWFTCACCPPNAARLFTSLGRYAWGVDDTTVYSHLFIAGELDLSASHGMKIQMETEYPADGTVTYHIQKAADASDTDLAIRIPGWSKHTAILMNRTPAKPEMQNGYAMFRNMQDGDTITLSIDVVPRFVYPSPRIPADSGKVAIMCGPLVYCAEGCRQSGRCTRPFREAIVPDPYTANGDNRWASEAGCAGCPRGGGWSVVQRNGSGVHWL